MPLRIVLIRLAVAVLYAGVACSAGGAQPPLVEHAPQHPGDLHSATVIFLHGLGDTGRGWQAAARRLSKQLPHVKFILPTAPKRAVTMNRGHVMPAWYDIATLPGRGAAAGADRKHDIEGIREAAAVVERIAADEHARFGIPRSRVVVGGFSQGATVSLFTGLSNNPGGRRKNDDGGESEDEAGDGNAAPSVFGGVVALSGYLAGADSFADWGDAAAAAAVPILQCHGTDDPVVPFAAAVESERRMRALGCGANLVFESFDGLAHRSSQAELRTVLAFLKQRLPPVPPPQQQRHRRPGGGGDL